MKRVAGSVAFTLRAHVATILLAALAIGVLSAGIRHVESGLACADRAVCYGQIGHTQAAGAPAIDARRALTPQSWAKRAHRLLASALVVLALALVYRTRKAGLRSGPAAVIPLTMVALLLALAIVGPMSHLKTLPGIATVNLLGGTALAALAWRLLLTLAPETRYRSTSVLRHGTRIALLLLVLQIVSGAWVSANFAGLACSGLPGCIDTPAVAVAPSAPALAPARELALDPAGRVVTDATAFTINTLHRVGALASALALGLACSPRRGRGFRRARGCRWRCCLPCNARSASGRSPPRWHCRSRWHTACFRRCCCWPRYASTTHCRIRPGGTLR